MKRKSLVKLISVVTLAASLCMTSCGEPSNLTTENHKENRTISTESDIMETEELEDLEDLEETEELDEPEVRRGSRMDPLGVGDSIDLVTRDTSTYQITYYFTITLVDVTDGVASFDIHLNDSSRQNPLKLYHYIDEAWNVFGTILFCGSATAASCDWGINSLGVTEDVVIGCGESGTVKVDISEYDFIGIATMFYQGDVEPDPADYDSIVHPTATDVPDTGYQYLTVFKVQ